MDFSVKKNIFPHTFINKGVLRKKKQLWRKQSRECRNIKENSENNNLKSFDLIFIYFSIPGNKSDLAGRRQVEESTAAQFAAERGLAYIETSAMESANIFWSGMQLYIITKIFRL